MIPYGQHTLDEEDIAAVVQVLQQEFLTQGRQVPLFERALCDYTGASHAVAVNSGTSALHIACLALDVGPGDLVWTVPNSFAASANCALYCGAQVDFVDINPRTRNLDVAALTDKLAQAKLAGKLPKVLIPVHFSGTACDMLSIVKLCQQYDVRIIEDAAHGLGGQYSDGRNIGSSHLADMTILSFHPVKSITTGEGGAVTTASEALADKLRLFASHGIQKSVDSSQPWLYQQQMLGFNYRLSDIHAALGVSQMTRLEEFIAQRRRLAQRYDKLLADLPLKRPQLDLTSAWHLYVVELTEHDRTTVFNRLRDAGIGVNVHYIPIHWHPYYQQLGFARGQFPNAEAYYQAAITLPLFPSMTDTQQDIVVSTLRETLT